MANRHFYRWFVRAFALISLVVSLSFGLWMISFFCLAEYHLRLARKALSRQRYEPALAELHEAIWYRPVSADLHLLAGRTARQAGKYPVAWEHLHKCRALQKGVTSELQLEELLIRVQNGELEEVFPNLVPHLEVDDSQTPLVLEALAHNYLFVYRMDDARQCIQRWLYLEPDNVEALFLSGNYYSLALHPELAIPNLQRALELDPDRFRVRLLLAQTLKEWYRDDEAKAEYRTVLRQYPQNLEARLGLASCLVDEKLSSEAEKLLQDIPIDDEKNPELTYLQGRIAEAKGEYKLAEQLLRRTIETRPSDRTACYHLIQCYQHLGDDASASKYQDLLDRIEKDLARLVEIPNDKKTKLGTDPALCCELGEVCLRLGLKRRGLHWLQAALFLDPHYRRAHQQLLHYYEQLGPEGAEEAAFHRRMLSQ